MVTCFVPYGSRSLGRYRETACFRFVFASTHANEPTCPACRVYVDAERADTRTGEDVFGTAADDFARLGGVR